MVSHLCRSFEVELTSAECRGIPKRLIETWCAEQGHLGYLGREASYHQHPFPPRAGAGAECEKRRPARLFDGDTRLQIEPVLLVSSHVIELAKACFAGRQRYSECVPGIRIHEGKKVGVVLDEGDAAGNPGQARAAVYVGGTVEAGVGATGVVERAAGGDTGGEGHDSPSP